MKQAREIKANLEKKLAEHSDDEVPH